ncbi:hypothetical protein VTG60DRAFT_1200 [Thermothelomyces hinnuleus]
MGPGPQSRVWLITGCSSGFGPQLAKVPAARGDRVLAASRNREKARDLSGQENIKVVLLDYNDDLAKIREAISGFAEIWGHIDVVVNNAAYVQTGTIEETTPEKTLRQFQANVFGPLNLYRAVLPLLWTRGHGTLVTIGSMAAWYPMNSCNLYNASKAALRWATLGLADEPGANLAGTLPTARLPEYDEINRVADDNFRKFNGKQLGDPIKGAEIIYDAVTSTGVAEGKEFPSFLPLGSDAAAEISKAAQKNLDDAQKWRPISALSDFPEGA